MGKIKSGLMIIKKIIFKYGDVIILPFSILTGILFNVYFETILKGNEGDNLILLIGIGLFFIQVLIIICPKVALKKEKKEIIEGILQTYSKSLSAELDSNNWSICGMVQVPKKDTRRTPYYINPASNPAIRNHRAKDFGDIGKAFFSGRVTQQYFVKRLLKSTWKSSPEEYKKDVPENLRAIISSAIFSTEENDSEKVIGVLEFDIFSESDTIVEMPKAIYDRINTKNNRDILCKWASVIGVLIESI